MTPSSQLEKTRHQTWDGSDFACPGALPKVWTGGFFHDGTFSSFRGRPHGRPVPAEVTTWRLVTFAQDHDQIRNRTAGDWLSQTLPAGPLAVAAVLTMTAPGTPMLFMGEEWGAATPWQFFTSHPEPELGEAVRKGRTAEFARMGWDESVVPDPQDPATFQRSKLDWDQPSAGAHARLLSLYRELARLRWERAELTEPWSGATSAEVRDPSGDPGRRVFRLGRGALSVLVNLSAASATFDAVAGDAVLLATDDVSLEDGAFTVPPDAAAGGGGLGLTPGLSA